MVETKMTEQEITLDVMSTSSEENIFTSAKKLQRDISQDLRQQYKGLNPNYHPGFFHRSFRFYHIKKPIAQNLDTYREFDLVTLPQVAYYLSQYKAYQRMNEESDPPCWIDCIRKKPIGGQLGSILNSHRHDFYELEEKLENILHQENIILDLQIEWCYNAIAMIEEMKYAEWLSGNFRMFEIGDLPKKTYQLTKAETLKKRILAFNREDILQTMHSIDALLPNEQIIALKNKILECTNERTRIDFIRSVKLNSIQTKDIIEKIKYFLERQILFGFMDGLLSEEKQFFWRWCLRAKFSKLNTHANDLSETCPIDKSQIYFNHEGYHSLLNVQELIRNLSTLQYEGCDLKILNEVFQQYKSDCLDDYCELSKRESWKTLVGFEDCEWENYLTDYFEKNLKTPLIKMNAFLNKIVANPDYEPNDDEKSFYDLYEYLKINIYQVEYLESENEVRPVAVRRF